MPRAVGQIDRAKNEAILDAAAEILTERGMSAPMSLIAKRANVSKQTIYNHYGAKIDLVQALVTRRVDRMTAPLDVLRDGRDIEEALTDFAGILIRFVCGPRGSSITRLTIQSSAETPRLAQDFYEAGPLATNRRLAAFMKAEMDAGRIETASPEEAAEFFTGMAAGHKQMISLLGFPAMLGEEAIDELARRTARRFLRAYAI